MNFLEKAKKKQAELKVQYDKASKGISSFKIGDSSAGPAPQSAARTPVSDAGSFEAGSRDNQSAPAELDGSQTASTARSTLTPTTTTGRVIDSTPVQSMISGTVKESALLSLVQRKDARDKWEDSAKPVLEERLSKVLGVKWTLDGDAGHLLNIKGDGAAADIGTPGIMIEDYMSSAVRRIESIVEWFGVDAADEINTLAPLRVISLELDTEIIKAVPPDQYNRTDFQDGRLCILIHRDHLWSNTPNVCTKLERTILRARVDNIHLQGKIDFVAKRSIREDWENEMETLQDESREALNDPDFVFNPQFLEVWRGLDVYASTKAGKKKTKDMLWPEVLGGHMCSYYRIFVQKLKDEHFEDDEMLQKAFRKGVPKGTATFRLVEQTLKKSHELVIENGILYLQTKAEDFLSGVGPVADNLMEII